MLDTVGRWQEPYLDALGRRLVYAADEYYLLAGRPFPDADDYDGFAQHENGIGMARLRAEFVPHCGRSRRRRSPVRGPGFFAWVDGAPADGYRARARRGRRDPAPARAARARRDRHRRVRRAGARAAAVDCSGRPTPVRLVPVENRFFGGNIAVTGLLTGRRRRRVRSRREPRATGTCCPTSCLSAAASSTGPPGDLPPGRGRRHRRRVALVAALR